MPWKEIAKFYFSIEKVHDITVYDDIDTVKKVPFGGPIINEGL